MDSFAHSMRDLGACGIESVVDVEPHDGAVIFARIVNKRSQFDDATHHCWVESCWYLGER